MIENLLNKYFKSPVIYDFIIALSMTLTVVVLIQFEYYSYPETKLVSKLCSDFSNISLTLSGLVLTIITILISFKESRSIERKDDQQQKSKFHLFFDSKLYIETVRHFKNCMKVLVLISIFGYASQLIFAGKNSKYLLFIVVPILVVVSLTIWRSLLVLTKILKIQNN